MTHPPDAGELLAAAVAGGDPDEVAAVASRNIWRLVASHFDEFIAAVEALPGDVLRRFPALYLVHPSTPVVVRSTRSLGVSAFEAYEGDGDEGPALQTALQMLSARMGGDVVTAVACARRLSELIRRDRAGDPTDPTGPLWFFHEQIGSTLLCAGRTSAAIRELATARQYGEVRENHDAMRTTNGRVAIAFAARGSLEDAERSLRAARSLPPPSSAFRPAALSTERTAAALISVERMDAEAACRVAELGEVDVFDVIWPFIFLARVRHQLAAQRPADALETVRLTASSHLIQQGTYASDLLTAYGVEANLALGDTHGAADAAAAASHPGPFTRLARVRIALYGADPAEAHRLLRTLATGSSSGPTQLAELHLLTACAESLDPGGVSPGLATRISALAATGSFRRAFACTPSTVIDGVRARLGDERRARFDDDLAGLSYQAPLRPRPVLTPAERRVLAALAGHPSTAEVASVLGVSPNTVKSQLRTLYRKLDVGSRDDAIAAANRLAL